MIEPTLTEQGLLLPVDEPQETSSAPETSTYAGFSQPRTFTDALSDKATGLASSLVRGLIRPMQIEPLVQSILLSKIPIEKIGETIGGETGRDVARAIRRVPAQRLLRIGAIDAALPESESAKQFAKAKTTKEKFALFFKDPIETMARVTLESLPSSILGAVAGTAIGGPGIGTASGVGLSSAATTFTSEFLSQAAQKQDISSVDNFLQFLDSENFKDVFMPTMVKSLVVGGVDAGTAKVAGRWVEPLLKDGIKKALTRGGLKEALEVAKAAGPGKVLTASLKEQGFQSLGGGFGEFAGQVASGQKIDPYDIFMESVAEFSTGPIDIAANIRESLKNTRTITDRKRRIDDFTTLVRQKIVRQKISQRLQETQTPYKDVDDVVLRGLSVDILKLNAELQQEQDPVKRQELYSDIEDMVGAQEAIAQAKESEAKSGEKISGIGRRLSGKIKPKISDEAQAAQSAPSVKQVIQDETTTSEAEAGQPAAVTPPSGVPAQGLALPGDITAPSAEPIAAPTVTAPVGGQTITPQGVIDEEKASAQKEPPPSPVPLEQEQPTQPGTAQQAPERVTQPQSEDQAVNDILNGILSETDEFNAINPNQPKPPGPGAVFEGYRPYGYDPATRTLWKDEAALNVVREKLGDKFPEWDRRARLEEKIHRGIHEYFGNDTIRAIGRGLNAAQRAVLKAAYGPLPEGVDEDIAIGSEHTRRIIQRLIDGKTTELAKAVGGTRTIIQQVLELLDRFFNLLLPRVTEENEQTKQFRQFAANIKRAHKELVVENAKYDEAVRAVEVGLENSDTKQFVGVMNNVRMDFLRATRSDTKFLDSFETLKEVWSEKTGETQTVGPERFVPPILVQKWKANQGKATRGQSLKERLSRRLIKPTAKAEQPAKPDPYQMDGTHDVRLVSGPLYGQNAKMPQGSILLLDNPFARVAFWAIPKDKTNAVSKITVPVSGLAPGVVVEERQWRWVAKPQLPNLIKLLWERSKQNGHRGAPVISESDIDNYAPNTLGWALAKVTKDYRDFLRPGPPPSSNVERTKEYSKIAGSINQLRLFTMAVLAHDPALLNVDTGDLNADQLRGLADFYIDYFMGDRREGREVEGGFQGLSRTIQDTLVKTIDKANTRVPRPNDKTVQAFLSSEEFQKKIEERAAGKSTRRKTSQFADSDIVSFWGLLWKKSQDQNISQAERERYQKMIWYTQFLYIYGARFNDVRNLTWEAVDIFKKGSRFGGPNLEEKDRLGVRLIRGSELKVKNLAQRADPGAIRPVDIPITTHMQRVLDRIKELTPNAKPTDHIFPENETDSFYLAYKKELKEWANANPERASRLDNEYRELAPQKSWRTTGFAAFSAALGQHASKYFWKPEKSDKAKKREQSKDKSGVKPYERFFDVGALEEPATWVIYRDMIDDLENHYQSRIPAVGNLLGNPNALGIAAEGGDRAAIAKAPAPEPSQPTLSEVKSAESQSAQPQPQSIPQAAATSSPPVIPAARSAATRGFVRGEFTLLSGKVEGTQAVVEWAIIEAANLENLIRSKFGDSQTRMRNLNPASLAQINAIATRPEILRLGDSASATEGAPTLDDLGVIAGNGRAMGILLAYNAAQNKPESAQRLRDFASEAARALGMPEDQIALYKQPVVVRRVKYYVNGRRDQFVSESNPKQQLLQETKTEEAIADSKVIGDVANLEFNENGDLTAEAARELGFKLDAENRGVKRDYKGDVVIPELTKRVQQAGLAQLATSSGLRPEELREVLELGGKKRLLSKILKLSSKIATIKDSDLSIAGDVIMALQEIRRGLIAVEQGAVNSIEEWWGSRKGELLLAGLGPKAEILLDGFVNESDAFTVKLLERYVNEAANEQSARDKSKGDFFDKEAPRVSVTGESILERVAAAIRDEDNDESIKGNGGRGEGGPAVGGANPNVQMMPRFVAEQFDLLRQDVEQSRQVKAADIENRAKEFDKVANAAQANLLQGQHQTESTAEWNRRRAETEKGIRKARRAASALRQEATSIRGNEPIAQRKVSEQGTLFKQFEGRKRKANLSPETLRLIGNPEIFLQTDSFEELNRLLDDPALGLGPTSLGLWKAIMSTGLIERLPAMKLALLDYLYEGKAEGVYLVGDEIVKLYRWCSKEAPAHELLHHVYKYLQRGDKEALALWRKQAVMAKLAKTKDAKERGALQTIAKAIQRGYGISSKEAVEFPPSVYHLINDSEFFVAGMMGNVEALYASQISASWFQTFLGWIRELYRNIRDALGLTSEQDDLWARLISGKYNWDASSAAEYAASVASDSAQWMGPNSTVAETARKATERPTQAHQARVWQSTTGELLKRAYGIIAKLEQTASAQDTEDYILWSDRRSWEYLTELHQATKQWWKGLDDSFRGEITTIRTLNDGSRVVPDMLTGEFVALVKENWNNRASLRDPRLIIPGIASEQFEGRTITNTDLRDEIGGLVKGMDFEKLNDLVYAVRTEARARDYVRTSNQIAESRRLISGVLEFFGSTALDDIAKEANAAFDNGQITQNVFDAIMDDLSKARRLPDTPAMRPTRAKFAAIAAKRMRGNAVDIKTFDLKETTTEGARLVNDIEAEIGDLEEKLEAIAENSPEAAKRAKEMLSIRDRSVELMAARKTLGDPIIRETFVESRNRAMALSKEFGDLLSSFKEIMENPSDEVYVETEKGVIALELIRVWRQFQQAQQSYERLAARRRTALEGELARIESSIQAVQQGKDEVEIFLREINFGNDMISKDLALELSKNWGAVMSFAKNLAARRWPNRSVKAILSDLLDPVTRKGGTIPDEYFVRTNEDQFGVGEQPFQYILQALKQSRQFNDAVTALVDYYRKQNKKIFKPGGTGVLLRQAQQILNKLRLLASPTKQDGSQKTDEEKSADIAQYNKLVQDLITEAETSGSLGDKLISKKIQEWTDVASSIKAWENGEIMFRAVLEDEAIPPAIEAAETVVGGKAQVMVLVNSEEITFEAFGDVKIPIKVKPSMLNETAHREAVNWLERAQMYVEDVKQLIAEGKNPELEAPTQDRPYRYNMRHFRGLQNAITEYEMMILDPSQSMQGGNMRPNFLSQMLSKLPAFRILMNGLERVGGVTGKMARHMLIAFANLDNKLAMVYSKHREILLAKRTAAIKSHPELKNVEEEYNTYVLSTLGSMGRRFSYQGQRGPKAGDVIKQYGITITPQDIAFAKALIAFYKDIDAVRAYMNPNLGTVEKERIDGGRTAYFVRRPQPVGDLPLSMFMGGRAHEFLSEIKEAYDAAVAGGFDITGENVDLSAQSQNPIVKFWNERPDLLWNAVEDAGREYSQIKYHATVEAAQRSLSVKVERNRTCYKDAFKAESMSDFLTELFMGKFSDGDNPGSHLPAGNVMSFAQFKAAWLDGLAQYYREAKAIEGTPNARAEATANKNLRLTSEFESPASPFRIPSSLYDYGALSDRDCQTVLFRAKAEALVNMDSAFGQCETMLRDSEKQLREKKTTEANQPGTIDEINRLARLISRLRADVVEMYSGKMELTDIHRGWPPNWLKASMLAGLPVNIKNVTLAHIAIISMLNGLRRYTNGLSLLYGLRNLVKAARSFVIHVLMNDNTKLTRANRDFVLGVLDSIAMPWAKHIAEVWIRGHFNRMDAMLDSGINTRRKFVQMAKLYWEAKDIAKDKLDAEKRDTTWGAIVRKARAAKQIGTLGLRMVGTEFFDLLINSEASTFIELFERELADAANDYGKAREGLGKFDPTKKEWMVTADEFSHRVGSGKRKSNLANWRKLLDRANLSLEPLLWETYQKQKNDELINKEENRVGHSAIFTTTVFTPQQQEALLQAWARMTNAGDIINRPTEVRTNKWLASATTFMGYSIWFANEMSDTLNNPRDATRAEKLLNNFGTLVFLSITAAVFGLLSFGFTERYKKWFQNRKASALTIFDRDFYTLANAKENTFAAIIASIPFVSDLVLFTRGQIVNNRGYDPAARILPISLANDLFSAVRGLWGLRGDPKAYYPIPLPVRDLLIKYGFMTRELAQYYPGYGEAAEFRQGAAVVSRGMESAGLAPERPALRRAGINYTPVYGMRERLQAAMNEQDADKFDAAIQDFTEFYTQKGMENPEKIVRREVQSLNPMMRGMGGKKPTEEEWEKAKVSLSPSQKEAVEKSVRAWQWGMDRIGADTPLFKGTSGGGAGYKVSTPPERKSSQSGIRLRPMSANLSSGGFSAKVSPTLHSTSGVSGASSMSMPRISASRIGMSSSRPSYGGLRRRSSGRTRMSRIGSRLRKVKISKLSLPRTSRGRFRKLTVRKPSTRRRRISVRGIRKSRRISFA